LIYNPKLVKYLNKTSFETMIEKVNFNQVEKKPLNEIHGEKVLYQLIWRFTPKAEILKAFKGVAKLTVPPGETNLMHSHPKEEQIYIILSGSGIIQIGEEKSDAVAGDVIYLPMDVPHGFFNTGKIPALILNIGAGIA
jgi:mannose-6-phosphate isomerase-like protein (cupin superfamily)